jgi:hypothetical protein
MICFKCDSEEEAAFFQEEFPCTHCDGTNLVEYNICPDCGWMWRSVNGMVFEDSQMNIQDIGDFAGLSMDNLPEMTDGETEMMENINEHLIKISKMDSGEASMSDYVHKCLECQSTAVDVNDGKYKCTDCDFEWEIVKFE